MPLSRHKYLVLLNESGGSEGKVSEQATEILQLNEQRSKERMTGGPPSEAEKTGKEPACQRPLKGGEGVELRRAS